MKTAFAIPAAAAVLLLAGCGATPAAQPSAAAPSPTVRPSTYYGQEAASIAASIPGCQNPAAGPVDRSGAASVATCTLGGRTLTIYSWADAGAAAAAASSMNNLAAADGVDIWDAEGTGWTASTLSTTDIQGGKTAAEAVVAALGGTVHHYQP